MIKITTKDGTHVTVPKGRCLCFVSNTIFITFDKKIEKELDLDKVTTIEEITLLSNLSK